MQKILKSWPILNRISARVSDELRVPAHLKGYWKELKSALVAMVLLIAFLVGVIAACYFLYEYFIQP